MKRRSDEGTKGRDATPFVASCLRRSVAHSARKAFSLVEVMIVVVIIGLMAGVVTYATTGYLDRAKVKRAKADLATLSGALDSYYADNSRFPDNQQGLKALVPQYVKVLQNDPWGHPYRYVMPGRTGPYDLITYGADAREGGTGPDADLTSNDVDTAQKKK